MAPAMSKRDRGAPAGGGGKGGADSDEETPLVAAGKAQSTVVTIEERAPAENDPKHPMWVVILYYTLASGTLLVINKVAIVQLPAPTFVLLCQLAFSAASVLAAHAVGAITIAKATPRQLTAFVPVVITFLGTIYANVKVLQYSNIETFITFRSSTPLVLAFCDWAFLGRHLPSGRSWLSLLLLLLSAAGYAYFDQGFVVDTAIWLFVWYVFFVGEGVVVKALCDNVPMSNWARVYYANLMSSPILVIMLALAPKERALLAATQWRLANAGPLALSCVVGAAMSHASYLLRSHAAATTAAVVGIVCKLLSVSINLVIWDKHAGVSQLGFLLMGIFAAAFYKQAPMRPVREPKLSDNLGRAEAPPVKGGGA